MNRIDYLFNTKKKGVFSVFFTAGFPHIDDTCTIIRSLQAKGIDMLEIGIPFSDPMADGLTIQQSSEHALKQGMGLNLLFAQLQAIRTNVHIPLIMMGYLNPIMQYGFDAFCKSCQQVGIDGIIIPDLPFLDYQKEYRAIAEKYKLHIIMLITPETSEDRIRLIDTHTKGFIYMVSAAATTGTKDRFNDDQLAYFMRIKQMKLSNPCLIGFGISNPSTFQQAQNHAQGAIIGSKFIQLLQSEKNINAAVDALVASVE